MPTRQNCIIRGRPTPIDNFFSFSTSSFQELVDLHLHDFLKSSRLLPEVLTNALSGVTQLRSLSLHFTSSDNHLSLLPSSVELVVLPALTRFKFQGTTEYLEDLVARIDTPLGLLLRDIEITFYNKSNFDLSSKFRNFTDRIGMHKSYRRADIQSCKSAISISLTQPGDPSCLKFQLFCTQLSEQLFFMTRFCVHFSAFLFNVEDLRISAKRPSRPEHGLYTEQWLEPSTHSQRPVELQFSCYLCDASPIQPHELTAHFEDKHSHRRLCSYCGAFELKYERLFRNHLEGEHPEVACKDALISTPFLTPSQLHGLILRHSFLSPSDIVPPTITMPLSQY